MAGLSAARDEVDALTTEVERHKPDAVALTDALVEIKTLSTEIQKRNAAIYFLELDIAKKQKELEARSFEAYRDGKIKALEGKLAQLKTNLEKEQKYVPVDYRCLQASAGPFTLSQDEQGLRTKKGLRAEVATTNQVTVDLSAQVKASKEQQTYVSILVASCTRADSWLYSCFQTNDNRPAGKGVRGGQGSVRSITGVAQVSLLRLLGRTWLRRLTALSSPCDTGAKQQSIQALEVEVVSLRGLVTESDAQVATALAERDTSRRALCESTVELEQAQARIECVLSTFAIQGGKLTK